MDGKIRSIEEVFDWYLKAIDVKLDRKTIERYIKNESQKVEKNTDVFDNLVNNILESIEFQDNSKEHFKYLLENFIEVYKCFTQYVESYHTSQKQLDFLLAKDIVIPFLALFSSYVFGKHLIILRQIKPDEVKKSFQKFLVWAERNICQQDIKKYLIGTYEKDEDYDKGYDTVRKLINSWLDLEEQTIPKKEHLQKIVQYLKYCNKATHLNLHNLSLFSKLFQFINKELENNFNYKEIELLVEHYFCLLEFYSVSSTSFDIQETEYRIYTELLNHINPNIINLNHYFDDYFIWLRKVVKRDYITPYKLIKKVLERNRLFYNLSETDCMKYIETNLPVLYFNKTKHQNEYVDLWNQMNSQKDNIEQLTQSASSKLLTKLYVEHLDMKKEKTLDDKTECHEIFKKLESEFKEDDTNQYICFLKTRYFIFDNKPKEALEYCKKCVELGIGKLGEHFKEAVMTGILLSAKNNRKKEYNFFRTIAIKYDSLFFNRLKIPAYGRGGKVVDIPEDKNNFTELINEYNNYFCHKFE
ncbi:hypothetical protein CRV01_03065 [Arcobacter sp. CECT 8983]|uniref:hypothetical protein n=1 Tax=Arcobacter sp. CECT 8983 TaxID=2044508 RepID=UPI00100A35E1|nr:hypothetical protein [Arcobacter sp. CECT 8983]RXJ90156.1 hypothetical protein CRV01_03065 [Arcobacter sp. CECT 8983]